ncbi:MAG: TolC family protein [Nitrospirae bacterium]|nr:TolC family protein [Nitrospirota bacterium]
MKRKTIVVLLTACMIVPAALYAEQGPIGLRDAIGIAFENNHEIRAFRNSLAAQEEDIGIAKSSLLPRLTFEERFMSTTNPTYAFMAKLNQQRFTAQDFDVVSLNNPSATNDFQTSFSFEQPVFAKKAYIGLDMAKKEYRSKNDDYVRMKQETALKVVRAYLAVLTAKEYVSASEKATEDAKEHLRIAKLRYDAGLGLYSDTLRASTALTETEQKLVSAEKNLDVAKRALGLVMGRSEPVEPAGERLEFPLRGVEYYTNASMERKDISALAQASPLPVRRVKLAEAGYFPVVGIGGSYQFNDHRRPFGSEGESWQMLAFLRWELFDGTKREHERSKAKYQAAETEEHLEGLKKTISFRVYEAYLTAKEAIKNAELAEEALGTAEEGKRLVEERYENSLSPMVDLLDAQVSLDHARANAAARENERRLAVANLACESGTILKDLNIE